MSTTPGTASIDPDDPTPLVSTSKIDPSDVPEYEREAARNVSLASGGQQGSEAHVAAISPNTIDVDMPNAYSSATQAHELQHTIQQGNTSLTGKVQNLLDPNNDRLAGTKVAPNDQDTYDYGGTDGLAKHLASGKTISDLTAEQQASVPQNYMKEYVKAEKAGDTKAIDKLNKTYEPAIKQLRNMADKSKTTINATPDAPGAPPAELTGLAKALPGMYSKSTASANLTSKDVHNPPAKVDTSKTMVVQNPKGLSEPGNLDITNRPAVKNADGTHSTEYSTSFNVGGKEVLVPTIVNGKFLTPDGKKPAEGSAAEKTMLKAALQHYKDTGEHLGKFNDAKSADAYASQLHNRGEKPPTKTSPSVYNGAAKAMTGGKKNVKTR